MTQKRAAHDNAIILMADPAAYGIGAPDPEKGFANAFQAAGYKAQQADPKGFKEVAIQQWTNLHDAFINAGATVIVQKTFDGALDHVFTADPSLSLVVDGVPTTLISKFTNVERQPEVNATVEKFKELATHSIYFSPYNIEGSGDNVYDPYRDVFFSGVLESVDRENAHLGRTDKRAHNFLSEVFNTKVSAMTTANGFFHRDTSTTPLPRGEILVYPNGVENFDTSTFVKEHFLAYNLDPAQHYIEVDKADADRLACNVQVIGNTLVMAECSPKLEDTLKRRGYDVVTVDLTNFIYSGGASHCEGNNINVAKINGGYHAMENRHLMPPMNG